MNVIIKDVGLLRDYRHGDGQWDYSIIDPQLSNQELWAGVDTHKTEITMEQLGEMTKIWSMALNRTVPLTSLVGEASAE